MPAGARRNAAPARRRWPGGALNVRQPRLLHDTAPRRNDVPKEAPGEATRSNLRAADFAATPLTAGTAFAYIRLIDGGTAAAGGQRLRPNGSRMVPGFGPNSKHRMGLTEVVIRAT